MLPWEVVERIIGHCGDYLKTLRSFSLTCRDLRPRALCLLVSHVRFVERDQIFDFCDFLQASPHLKSLVLSIAVDPDHFAPYPLLSILPNLSTLTFVPTPVDRQTRPQLAMPMNRSSLACYRHLGTHIQALHFSNLIFTTYLEFARILSAFTNVVHLVCSKVFVKSEGNRSPLEVFQRRLSRRVKLLTVSLLPCYRCEEDLGG